MGLLIKFKMNKMKRLIILLISFLCYSQAFSEEHLKFLGYPIDGTVNEYAAHLKTKVFYVSPQNKYASKGLRVMKGPFLGNTEEFGLHYDPDTKKMWSVTFVRSCFTEKEALELYDKLESLIREKHFEASYKSPLTGLFVSSCSFQSDKGIITLVIIENDYDYQVKMSYTDKINYRPVYKKRHQKMLDDM